jgi:hypothetical protein
VISPTLPFSSIECPCLNAISHNVYWIGCQSNMIWIAHFDETAVK